MRTKRRFYARLNIISTSINTCLFQPLMQRKQRVCFQMPSYAGLTVTFYVSQMFIVNSFILVLISLWTEEQIL